MGESDISHFSARGTEPQWALEALSNVLAGFLLGVAVCLSPFLSLAYDMFLYDPVHDDGEHGPSGLTHVRGMASAFGVACAIAMLVFFGTGERTLAAWLFGLYALFCLVIGSTVWIAVHARFDPKT